jgi:hypothetical protein
VPPVIRRLSLLRRAPEIADVATLRARELRVLNLGRWLLVYTPRDHWSYHL